MPVMTKAFNVKRPSKAHVTLMHDNTVDGGLSCLHVTHPANKKLICTVHWPGGSAVVCTNTQHPVKGLSSELIGAFTNSDIKVVYLARSLRVGTAGAPSVWVPKNAESHANVLRKLQGCPLSIMGYALSLASLGEEFRDKYSTLFVTAFGTIEHPFQGVRNPALDEAISVAYAGVGLIFLDLNTYCCQYNLIPMKN